MALGNIISVLLVCTAGAGGWLVAWKSGAWTPTGEPTQDSPDANISVGPQILGYISAICYLGYGLFPWKRQRQRQLRLVL